MRRTIVPIVLIFFLFQLVAAQSATQPPGSQPPPRPAPATVQGAPARAVPEAAPSHKAAAEELLAVMRMEQATKDSADVMLEMQLRQNPMLNQFKNLIQDFMAKYLAWDQLKPEYVGLYTELYTEPEIRDMIAFYGTPLGRKMQTTMPQLMARSAEISQKRLQEHMPELQGQIMARIQEQQKQQQQQQQQPQPGQPAPGQPSAQPAPGQPPAQQAPPPQSQQAPPQD